ncbi:hypothetical protein Gogos_012053, partial [Gossypium gossypioides]|nr:hypothetical protein [Gossypium gossypioides]
MATTHFNPTFKGSTQKAVELNPVVLDLGSKGRGSRDKRGSSRGVRKLNRTTGERGELFKLAGTSKVPLSESMNSTVELINSQLNMDVGKVSVNSGDKPIDGTRVNDQFPLPDKEGIFERLDREIGNGAWVKAFPYCSITHLPRDMVTDEGLWNLELFRVLLSNDIIKHIVNLSEAVAEGVVKDSHRHWILGFNRRLGLCYVFNAELWGILDGLIVIYNKRWEKVSIRTDSLE